MFGHNCFLSSSHRNLELSLPVCLAKLTFLLARRRWFSWGSGLATGPVVDGVSVAGGGIEASPLGCAGNAVDFFRRLRLFP